MHLSIQGPFPCWPVMDARGNGSGKPFRRLIPKRLPEIITEQLLPPAVCDASLACAVELHLEELLCSHSHLSLEREAAWGHGVFGKHFMPSQLQLFRAVRGCVGSPKDDIRGHGSLHCPPTPNSAPGGTGLYKHQRSQRQNVVGVVPRGRVFVEL